MTVGRFLVAFMQMFILFCLCACFEGIERAILYFVRGRLLVFE